MKQYYQAKQWLFLLFLLLSAAGQAQAQTGSVSGQVTDDKKAGVSGATVLIEGTTIGTAANIDGTYLIQNVPAGPHVIVVSFVGYATLRKSVTVVAGQTVEAFASLSESATQLSEAVIVGYGTQRRQDVTGAIATVDTRQFVKGQVTSPEQLIQGKIAGVSITSNSGQPGVGSTIRIRGGSSLNASNDPLIVIDGVPVTNDNVSGAPNALSLINPNDIESYSILKDASATAIYGSRAANGVILITTKKGVQGDKLHLNFSSQFSVSQRAKKLQVLTGDEYRALLAKGYRTSAGDTVTFPTSLLGTANTDWQSEIYRTAYTFDNNLSLSGSAGKVPYRVSYGNLNQQGIIKTSELQRNTLAVGITPVLLGDRLRIDVNLKGSVAKNRFTDGAVVYNALAFNPTLPVRNADPSYAPYGGYTEILQASPTAGGNYQYEVNAPANPVSLLNSRDDRSTVYRSIGNVQLDLKIPGVSGLRANYNVGFDFQRGMGTTVLDPNSRAGVVIVDSSRTKGATSRYSQNRNSWLNEVYLAYAHDFEQWGRVDALVGYSYQNFYAFNPNNRAVSAAGYVFPTSAVTPYSSGENALQSVYGRLNYALKNRYLLTATLRRDQSSRFASDIRTGYFPAVGLGWRLKEEGFLREVGFVSELKLRAGYGITGQQSISVNGINSDYGYLPRYLAGSGQVAYQFGNAFVNTLRPQSYVADRKWENTTTWNAGLDYGFGANSRVTGALDFYYKRSTDLLFFGPLAAGSALGNEDYYNVGKFDSKGIELAINTAVIRGERLNWNLNFNAAYNKTNVVNTLRGGVDGTGTPQQAGAAGFNGVQYYAPGHPLNTYWVYKQKLDDQGRPFSTSGNTNAELLQEFEDLNGDGKIDSNDRYYAQQAAPKYVLGLTSNLTAGHAYFNFTLRSYLDNYNYNNVSAALNTYGNLYASNGNYFSNTTPLLGNQVNFISNQPFSDYYVQKANFVRCENITVGYSFPKLGGNDSRNLGLSFSVQNAFVLTPYKGIDPEVVNGIDSNAYPRARTYTLGLNLGF